MSSRADDFQPHQAVVDALVAQHVEPLIRDIEREHGAPVFVEGEVMVRDSVVATWAVVPASSGARPVRAAGRATFRKTGGSHVLFNVQVMIERLGESSWRGFRLEGRIHPDRRPIGVVGKARVFLHNQDDWLRW